MTAQSPEKLINEHPTVDFGGLHLYKIVRGDITQNYGWGDRYEFANPANPPKDVRCATSLWRGYIATFRLKSDGQLELVRYRYPVGRGRDKVQLVHETLAGNFWLVMKVSFRSPRTYVPFRSGRIVADRLEWIVEDMSSRRTRNRDDSEGM